MRTLSNLCSLVALGMALGLTVAAYGFSVLLAYYIAEYGTRLVEFHYIMLGSAYAGVVGHVHVWDRFSTLRWHRRVRR